MSQNLVSHPGDIGFTTYDLGNLFFQVRDRTNVLFVPFLLNPTLTLLLKSFLYKGKEEHAKTSS